MKIKPTSRKQNIVVQELEKELLVYDLQTNKAFCLNETSAIVYQLCDGKNSVTNISDLMSRKLKTLVPEDFIFLVLNELKKDGLLENDAQLNLYFSGFSRREMVRKVGLASMIALPLVSSVIAPTAAQAASIVCLACYTNAIVPTPCLPQPNPSLAGNVSECAIYCFSICCSGRASSLEIDSTTTCICFGVTCL